MKGIIPWIGGKVYLADKIVRLMCEHETYVEVFGGGMQVLFAKPPSGLEVYNDINGDLVNFWRVVRDEKKYKELQRKLALTPYSREEFYWMRDNLDKVEDDVERAYRWFVVAKASFSGCFGKSWSFAVGDRGLGISQAVSGYLSAIEGLDKIHARIMRVQIENYDYKKIFEIYDRPRTLFYCDPPYVLATRSGQYYEYEMSDEEHEEFINLALKLKGKVIISGYDHEIYRKLDESGWKRLEIEAPLFAQKAINGKKGSKKEVIWLNYQTNGGLFNEEND